MLASSIPVKFQTPFASGATSGYITTPIPLTTVSAGRASLTTGFPITTFEPEAGGGNPPFGADMNGLLYQATAWIQWAQAGGLATYDVAFSTAIGGYPNGAFLQSLTFGHFWISSADNNTTNPDTGGSNWTIFPDVIVQAQTGNAALDTSSTVNVYTITLSPAPASLAAIKYSPIRIISAHANTINNPTIVINGLSAVTMINSSGAPLGVGQISRAGQIVEGYLDGTYFQVTSPQPISGGGTGLQTGMILLCPIETPFVGTLECNGSLQLIASYPSLYNVIAAKYGGDGITTFALPDLRGEFVRGWDHGRGLDPNASTRTNRGDGVTGDHVGTNQTQAVGLFYTGTIPITIQGNGIPGLRQIGIQINDAGGYLSPWNANSNLQGGGDTPTASGMTFMGAGRDFVSGLQGTTSLTINAGPETRPVNIYMMYVIVY